MHNDHNYDIHTRINSPFYTGADGIESIVILRDIATWGNWQQTQLAIFQMFHFDVICIPL